MAEAFELDMSAFDAAIKAYLPTTSRELSEIIDQRALNIAVRALRHTPQADRGRIERELGVSRVIYVSKKSGAQKEKRVVKPVPLIYAMAQARRRRAGLPPLKDVKKDNALSNAARRIIGGKMRSVGFMRSGYIPVIRKLNTRARFKAPFGFAQGASVKGQPKGEAIPSVRGSWNPSTTIINKVQEVGRFGRSALQLAINEEAAEINRHTEEKLLQKTADKFNAR